MENIKDEIAELLQYPVTVFAREKEGYRFLTRDFNFTNVKLSNDLVLQNAGVHLNNIYTNPPVLSLPEINTEHNIGIVPNAQCFRHGNAADVLNIYHAIIEELLNQEKEVYVFRHSGEDLAFCKKIAEMFENESHVHLLQNDFSCLEYDVFVKNFEFIICSRFHGIVHAYKNYIPAIALGWAVKYRELTQNVGQSAYIFDITAKTCDKNAIISAVRRMIENVDREKEVIRNHVLEIQAENCFECISEWVKRDNE